MRQVLCLYFFIKCSHPVYEAGTFIILFSKRGNQDSESLSYLTGVTQPVSGQVRIGTQIPLMPRPVLFLLSESKEGLKEGVA